MLPRSMGVMVNRRADRPAEVYPAGSVPDGAAALARDGAAGRAPVRGRRPGGGAAPAAPGGGADGHHRVAGRVGAGGRAGPARRRRRQRDLGDPAAGRLPGRRDRGRGQPGDGPPPPARGRLRVQAADLDAQAQGRGAGRVPGKRARVEALLAMASPAPPPVADLLADLATWIEAPGQNAKVTGFGALDWRDGFFHGLTAPGRRAQPLVDQLAALLARSRARGRAAIVLYDNLRIHTPAGSPVLRAFLAAHS